MPNPPLSSQSDSRDLLCELHDEQCAHGQTLMDLSRAKDALERIADIDPAEHSLGPVVARLRNAVAIARATLQLL